MYTTLVYFIFLSGVTSFSTTLNLSDFFADQSHNFINFLEERGNEMEEAFSSSYARAMKMKNSFDSYVEEQQNKISTEINSYIENVKDRGQQLANSFSYVQTQDAADALPAPDAALTVPARIARLGYNCETHTVISQGYVLNLHRIPYSKGGGNISSKTVLLQHGLFASSADWILNGPNKALAYVLADAGYDVWMANVRGNVYSAEHTSLKRNTKSYWNFSWHDIALYDVPAVIDYIMKLKGEDTQITYIGHSMGSTILFAMLTLRPEYNRVLTAGYALAPVAFMSDIKSPIKALAPLASNVAHMEMLYGSHEFLPKNSMFGKLVTSCSIEYADHKLCRNAVFQICGENEKQYNETLMPVFMAHFGAGTSWKTIVHYAQEVVAKGRFQFFDLGPWNNKRIYGAETPPEYDLSKITLPIKLFWAQNDLLSTEMDVKKLQDRLPATTDVYLVPDPKFNHLDYLWAIDAPSLLNNEILTSLQKSFNNFTNN
ncbi:PREDICTED: lipase 3-like [Papilio polytes]|uniref:lipase 3-like n=1 Tax=Papilio polytes TaxID=76194 RepID=UPI000676ACE5|nr:PREDICTED: lipase 3-like [Papilio polytes]